MVWVPGALFYHLDPQDKVENSMHSSNNCFILYIYFCKYDIIPGLKKTHWSISLLTFGLSE